MNTVPSKTTIVFKICAKSYWMLFVIAFSAASAYVLKQTIIPVLFTATLMFALWLLHKILNSAMIALIQLNQVRKAVLHREASYTELTVKEKVLNSIILSPISILIGIALYSVDNLAIKLGMLPIIFGFILVGETAKYRFKLYKIWYDENLK